LFQELDLYRQLEARQFISTSPELCFDLLFQAMGLVLFYDFEFSGDSELMIKGDLLHLEFFL
jgi:hypothetical protein